MELVLSTQLEEVDHADTGPKDTKDLAAAVERYAGVELHLACAQVVGRANCCIGATAATDLTGGMNVGGNNLRHGATLGFVDNIFYNEYFGATLYPTIFHRAAAYLFFTLKNHIFVDGNKRTGLACALTFLEWNGITIAPLDEDGVFDFVVDVAGGRNNPDEQIPRIAEWLRSMAV